MLVLQRAAKAVTKIARKPPVRSDNINGFSKAAGNFYEEIRNFFLISATFRNLFIRISRGFQILFCSFVTILAAIIYICPVYLLN
jgi:hypothetical protein